MLRSISGVAPVAATLLFAPVAAASCGSAFCLVNTNWGVQGVWNEPGARLDLRYEYIDQDQPRAGTRRVGVGEIPGHHDEVRTINHNLFATLDYGFSPEWGATLVVPLVDREHDHIHNHEGEPIPEHWKFTELGDVRAQARWQTPIGGADDPDRARFVGVTFGLKLPTGRHDIANDDGDVAERTLQPGSGTTDALVGAYYREALPRWNASWFVQASAQLPMNSRAGFKPGRQAGVDVGARYEASDRLSLMLQLNAHWKGTDSGAEAEPEDSGSRIVSLSPGVSFAVTPGIDAYAFVQLPLYQHVTGVQLTADWSVAAGLSMRF